MGIFWVVFAFAVNADVLLSEATVEGFRRAGIDSEGKVSDLGVNAEGSLHGMNRGKEQRALMPKREESVVQVQGDPANSTPTVDPDLAISDLASPQQLLDEKEKKALATVMQDPEVVIMKQDLIKRMKDMKDKMLEKMITEMFPKDGGDEQADLLQAYLDEVSMESAMEITIEDDSSSNTVLNLTTEGEKQKLKVSMGAFKDLMANVTNEAAPNIDSDANVDGMLQLKQQYEEIIASQASVLMQQIGKAIQQELGAHIFMQMVAASASTANKGLLDKLPAVFGAIQDKTAADAKVRMDAMKKELRFEDLTAKLKTLLVPGSLLGKGDSEDASNAA